MENSYTKWLELEEELERQEENQLPVVVLSRRLFYSVIEWEKCQKDYSVIDLLPLASLIMDLSRKLIAFDAIHFSNYFYYSLPKIFRFTLSLEYDYFVYKD